MELADIKGQSQATLLLKQIVEQGTSGRSYIFAGPAGSGKFSTALAFAQALTGTAVYHNPDVSLYRNDQFTLKTRFYLEQKDIQKNLDHAVSYLHLLSSRIDRAVSLGELKKSTLELSREIQEQSTPQHMSLLIQSKKFQDHLLQVSQELEAKKKIPVGYIRSVIEDHMQMPSGPYRISIIGDFENSSVESQNAILKLMEEPPARSIIILTTSSIKSLLATIISRSLVMPFKNLSPSLLSEIFEEKISSFKDCRGYMKEKVFHYQKKKKQQVRVYFDEIAPAVQKSHSLFSFIDQLETDSENGSSFLEGMIDFFRNLVMHEQLKIRGINPKIDLVDKEYQDILLKVKKKSEIDEARIWVEKITRLNGMIRYGNIKAKMVLPDLLIDIARWYQSSCR